LISKTKNANRHQFKAATMKQEHGHLVVKYAR